MQLNVTRYLKMILFLTNERIIRVGEVKSFVSIDTKVRDGSEKLMVFNE